ncbi:MAG TPA: amylo-alpha-1,6-glucosidase [Thermoanaerobaculia bacterium]|nr:amylo-alpha-1,6-glucosidase [Thermoanaerobaculia bacterium]
MDVHQPGWKRGEGAAALLTREWLVTNGLGGYASGTIGGPATRRFHGWLIAAMPAPLGRAMMLNHLDESIGGQAFGDADFLAEFSLDCGVPVWRYERDGLALEKRVVMPYGQNTAYLLYRLLRGGEQTLELRPAVNFRHHEGVLGEERPHTIDVRGREIEIVQEGFSPNLRMLMVGENARLDADVGLMPEVRYMVERDRGYEYEGPLWSPGVIRITLRQGEDAGLVVSTESWDVIHALNPHEAIDADQQRRDKMLSKAGAHDAMEAQLILAADQFLIRPTTRSADEARIAAAGDSPRTVIAGYHWFTDWGRDTMISLEGLTLCTGRHREAGSILRTFASYIRDGLIPNMFPEGEHGGLYHTADATMWFFHAVARYVRWTNDRHTLRELLPKMVEIIEHHVRGTHFNIHVDPKDGLLHQGAEGYQLTWMDAKVDGWVVTPRRGKAVEINALYYNALRVLETFLREEGETQTAERMRDLAGRAFDSFNERFWFADGQYLYDVLDPHDQALRPNQIFAISLDHPVLARERWPRVIDVVEKELVTPVGLRSLGRNHRDYKPKYDGDLRARDAAYHQGTVWGWLIGPFIDAWMKVHGDANAASRFLDGFGPHLGEACIGTISEIFDAEEPYTPRGCAAQAWSVAEVLRCVTSLRSA